MKNIDFGKWLLLGIEICSLSNSGHGCPPLEQIAIFVKANSGHSYFLYGHLDQ